MGAIEFVKKTSREWPGYAVAVGAVALATWLKYVAQPNIIPADVPILYIVSIVGTAIFFGLGPSLLACLLSLLAYDFYFIPPIHEINLLSIQEAPIVAVFLLVGLIISYLSANLRQKNQIAAREISARMKVEEELIQYQGRLEEMVKQRTAELEKANADLQIEIGQRKQIEESLRQSEQRWATTLASIGDAVIATDVSGRVSFMNSAAENLTGWNLAEASGKNIAEVFKIINEHTRQIVDNPVDKVLQEGVVCGLANHTILVRRDGTEVAIDDSGAPIRMPSGRTSGVVLVFRDITERKRAEDAVLRNEERLKRSQEMAHLGSWELDLEKDELSWSDEVYRIFGLQPQEFAATYEAFLEAVHPEDRAAVDAAYSDSLKEGRDCYDIEHRIIRKSNGEVRYVHEKCEHFRDQTGKIIRSIGMVHDITERNQAEEQNKRHARRRQMLLDFSTEVVAQKDSEGILVKAAEAVRIMAEARVAISGHRIVDGRFKIGATSRADGYSECQPEHEFIIGHGGIYLDLLEHSETLLLDSEQLPRSQAWRGLPAGHIPLKGLIGARLFNAQGEAAGVVMASDKVGGEFTAEDEVPLKQIATIASLALQQVEARQSAEARATELEATNKELEAFSYSVSHDLRSPLRALDGFSEILLEDHAGQLDDTARGYLEAIRKASQTMSHLIEDILKLSRVSRAELFADQISLSDLARSIADELKSDQPERQAEFIIPADIIVHGDRQLLQILMRNLLGNAWKFTGKKPLTRIELGVSQEGGKTVYFIEDNGVGFNSQYSDRLFKPFQRLHTSEEYPGTGIGLAIAERVVRRHNGSIWAESVVGKGATFYFTLK